MYLKTISLTLCVSFAMKTLALPLPAPQYTGSCSNEGEYNCISATMWQRCASGQWSVAMAMAAGTSCYTTFGTDSAASTTDSPSTIPVVVSPSTSAAAPPPTSPVAPPLTSAAAPPPPPAPSSTSTSSSSTSPTPSPTLAPDPTPAPPPPPADAPPAQSSSAPAAPISTALSTLSCPSTPASLAAAQSYSGPASNFPTASQWESFEAIWCLNLPALQINDDAADIASLQSAIQSVAAMTNGLIDPRVILAIVMQESSGNAHVVSTNNGVQNNGLMQSHDGVSYSASDPAGSILQMIKDGTLGVSGPNGGDGLEQTVQKFGGLWQGIRAYNSGSVDQSNLSNGLGSTNSYCSDVANRLMGAKSG